MSAQQSNLAAYGFDVVVATTQAAINANIKQYIHEFGKGASPTFKAYFRMNGDGVVEMLPSDQNNSLVNGYANTDPLAIAAWNGTGARPVAITNIQAVINTIFDTHIEDIVLRYAISFELGFPGGNVPSTDIIQLSDDGQYATYKLCFQNLTLAVANYNNDIYNGVTSYEVYTQTLSKIYEFTVRVPLASVNDNNNLPGDVAAQAAALGNAFTLQQLVLDLDNAAWYSQPVITDAPSTSEVYKMLDTVFLPLYAQLMAANGRAALGFNFIPNVSAGSNFGITNVQLQIDDVNSYTPPAIATLDYLCAVNGNQPQPRADFSDPDNYILNGLPCWNWFDTMPSVHGVIAVSPYALANYFCNALMDYVKSNCYLPSTSWYFNEDKEMWMVNPPSVQAGQTPTVSVYNGSGPLVSFSYTSPAGSGYSKDNYSDTQQLTTSFTLTVTQGADNTLIVTQELKIFYELSMGSTAKGNIVDTILTDTYTLATNATGQYAPAVNSNSQDNSQNVSFNGFYNFFDGDPNSMIATIKSWAQSLAAKNVTDIPVSVMQGLVFPGGNAFSMSNLAWSDGGDLIANINYALPAYITN